MRKSNSREPDEAGRRPDTGTGVASAQPEDSSGQTCESMKGWEGQRGELIHGNTRED